MTQESGTSWEGIDWPGATAIAVGVLLLFAGFASSESSGPSSNSRTDPVRPVPRITAEDPSGLVLSPTPESALTTSAPPAPIAASEGKDGVVLPRDSDPSLVAPQPGAPIKPSEPGGVVIPQDPQPPLPAPATKKPMKGEG